MSGNQVSPRRSAGFDGDLPGRPLDDTSHLSGLKPAPGKFLQQLVSNGSFGRQQQASGGLGIVQQHEDLLRYLVVCQHNGPEPI
jgi:hypothetical protein